MKAIEQEFKDGKFQDKENGLVLDNGGFIPTGQFNHTISVGEVVEIDERWESNDD